MQLIGSNKFYFQLHFHGKNMSSLHKHIPATYLPDTYGGSYPKPSLSTYEWEILLKSGDEEYASEYCFHQLLSSVRKGELGHDEKLI